MLSTNSYFRNMNSACENNNLYLVDMTNNKVVDITSEIQPTQNTKSVIYINIMSTNKYFRTNKISQEKETRSQSK